MQLCHSYSQILTNSTFRYISFLSAILYFLKRVEAQEPVGVHPADREFLNELWRLNSIMADFVISPIPSLKAYIKRFKLDSTFMTQQKTSMFAFNHMSEIPYLQHLLAPRRTIMRYKAPCRCKPNGKDTNVENELTPVFQVEWSDNMNLRTSILNLFNRRRIELGENEAAKCQENQPDRFGNINPNGCGEEVEYIEDYSYLATFTQGLVFCVRRERYILKVFLFYFTLTV